jgi:hypothetical protein
MILRLRHRIYRAARAKGVAMIVDPVVPIARYLADARATAG